MMMNSCAVLLRDMDSAMDLERADIPKRDNTVCPNCDNECLVYFCSGGHPGSAVCNNCGCVLGGDDEGRGGDSMVCEYW